MAVRVLILGGYGTFGGRLAHLLGGTPGLELIIAGRSLEQAERFCAALPGNRRAARVDRNGNLKQQIAALAPDILVDASGPFQAYGHAPYRVVEVTLELGVHYLDLADGSDFVAGIRRYDEAARQRSIFILSGVSSFPVLTLAVIRHLMQGLARLDSVRAGIAPSPYAGVGLNVIRAIASYAGQRVRVRRDGSDVDGRALTETMRYTVAPPGMLPLKPTLFSLVDVPDLRAIPEQWPEVHDVWAGAGPVPAILHRALIALSWFVRGGLVRSLAPFARVFFVAVNHLRWGEHRGGMFVAITGRTASGAPAARSWHMLAERDDGPLIPSMAVEALIRRYLDGRRPTSGARAATHELELDDYRRMFATRAIQEGTRDDLPPAAEVPLYRRVLGEAWDGLPVAIRAIHTIGSHATAKGRARVSRGTNVAARVTGALFRFPDASDDVAVTVDFSADGGQETWRRNFGGSQFTSRQRAGTGSYERLLVEQFGPFEFALALVVENGRLNLILRGWCFLGVPLPLRWAPTGTAYESGENGQFHFFVEIAHPLCGLIVRYQGSLSPSAERGQPS